MTKEKEGREHEAEEKITKRDDDISEALAESAVIQEEAADVLRQVASKLDKLSAEMRKHGAFPIAGQLERERDEVRSRANGLAARS